MMKQMLLIFILLLYTTPTWAHPSLGLDIGSLLYKEANIAIEYRIAEHWSISTSGGMNLKVLKRLATDEETEHDSNFHNNTFPQERTYAHRANASIRYWTKKVYSGMFLSLGGEYRSDYGLDANIGIGYMFSIWEGLSGVILYDTGIIRSNLSERLSLEDLKIGICWIF